MTTVVARLNIPNIPNRTRTNNNPNNNQNRRLPVKVAGRRFEETPRQ